jgi:catalase
MANIVSDTVKHAFMGSQGAKADRLSANTVEPTRDTRITSDFGTRQSNTDDWLRVNSDDKTGPMLLEDGFAREKVGSRPHVGIRPGQRLTSIDSPLRP